MILFVFLFEKESKLEIRFIFLKLKQNIKVQIFLGKVPIWIWNFCIFVSIALVLFFIINKQINWTDIPVWIQHDYTLTFSNAYISGWILYLIVHYIPERKQKEIVKRNLKKQYTWLKGKIIHEFLLSIYGHSDPELEVELLNVKKFNSFMDYKVNQSEVRSKKQEDEKLSNDEWLSSYSNRMNALINKINFDSFKEIQKDISIFNKHFLYFMQKIN